LDDSLSHHRASRHGDDGLVPRSMNLTLGSLAMRGLRAGDCGRRCARARYRDRQAPVRAQLGLRAVFDQIRRRPRSVLRRDLLRGVPRAQSLGRHDSGRNAARPRHSPRQRARRG
jgi:hypothetical protein